MDRNRVIKSDKKKIIKDLVHKGLSKGEEIQHILEHIFGNKISVDFNIKDVSYLHGLLRYRTDAPTHKNNLWGAVVLYTLVSLSILIGVVAAIPVMMATGFFDIWFVYQILLLPVVLFFPLLFFTFLFSISAYNLRKYRWFIYFVGLSVVADIIRFFPDFVGFSWLNAIDMVLRIIIFLLAIKLYVSMKKKLEIIDTEDFNELGELVKRRIIRAK